VKASAKKVKQRARKKIVEETNDEDDVSSSVIAQIYEDQQFRKRNSGTDVHKLSKKAADASSASLGGNKEAEPQYGLMDPKKDKNASRNLSKLMNGDGFTGQEDRDGKEQHEDIMEAFIEENLDGGRKKKEMEEEKKKPKVLTDEDRLYSLPENLKAAVESSRAKNVDDEDEMGGPLAWNTGIAEVEMPVESKMQNIEETEKARRTYMMSIGSGRGRFSSALPEGVKSGRVLGQGMLGNNVVSGGNFTANYSHHRREYALMMRAREGKGGQDSGGAFHGGGRGRSQSNFSSDDQAFQRHMKRSRR